MKQAPKINQLSKIELLKPSYHTLSNGIPLVIMNGGTQDLVKIEWQFKAGKWFENKQLSAFITNGMLREGSKLFNQSEVAETIDFYGAQLRTSSGRDFAHVTLTCLNKHLASVMEVVANLIKEPAFNENELNTLKAKNISQLRINSKKNKYIASHLFKAALFGENNPYGQIAKEEDYNEITSLVLTNMHKRRYTPEHCSIHIGGGVSEQVIDIVSNYFSDWKVDGQSDEPDYSFESSLEKRIYNQIPNSFQSAIRIGRPLFNKHHEDFHKFTFMTTLFGGFFGSRLMTNIREDKGYTYGIYSINPSFQKGGQFIITTETGVDVTKAALKEIYFELNRLRNEVPKAEEVELVRNYMLGGILSAIDGPFNLLSTWQGLENYSLSIEHFNKMIETISTIKPSEVTEMANKHLKEEDLYEVVVGQI